MEPKLNLELLAMVTQSMETAEANGYPQLPFTDYEIAVDIGPTGATFVKDYDFFVSQGGLTEKWGKNWILLEAESFSIVRLWAFKKRDASPGLHCSVCGVDKFECSQQHTPEEIELLETKVAAVHELSREEIKDDA